MDTSVAAGAGGGRGETEAGGGGGTELCGRGSGTPGPSRRSSRPRRPGSSVTRVRALTMSTRLYTPHAETSKEPSRWGGRGGAGRREEGSRE